MKFTKKRFRLPRLERRLTASAALFSLAVLLIPTQPFKPGAAHFIERNYPWGRETFELLKIYPLVKKEMTESSDGWAWTVSKTILEESKRHSLDPLLVLAVIRVESGFQHSAESPDGARGLMQIQPDFAKALDEQRRSVRWGNKYVGHDHPDLDNPVVNIKLGVFYLHYLQQTFRDLKLALTAYNRGPTQVKNQLVEEADVPLEYAMRVLSAYQGYRRELRQPD